MKLEGKNKSSKASEILWAVMAVVSLVAGIHKTYNHGFQKSLLFFGFVILSLIMYMLKRNMRIKNDNNPDL